MMNNNYDVMDDMHHTSEKRLSNQEYANIKKEERKQLSIMANDQAVTVASSPKIYLAYLGVQARLGYTVNNTLLVMNQFPNAKLVKDYDAWKKDNTYVKRNPVSIKILEPGNEFKRRDGSTGRNYVVKKVFDVSQTSKANESLENPRYDIQSLVTAITFQAEILPKITSNDSLLPSDVYYDTSAQEIFVKERLSPNTMLSGLIHEYCKAECLNKGCDESFIVDSAAYMIHAKYGIESKNIDFVDDVNRYFYGMDAKEIKHDLNIIKQVFDSIDRRMDKGLYNHKQEKDTKHVEHDAR